MIRKKDKFPRQDRIAEIITAIKNCSYKPNFEFIIISTIEEAVEKELIEIQLVHHTINSAHSMEDNPQNIERANLGRNNLYLSIYLYTEDIVKKLYEEVIRSELHEASEFFKYKGKAFWHPHLHLENFKEPKCIDLSPLIGIKESVIIKTNESSKNTKHSLKGSRSG